MWGPSGVCGGSQINQLGLVGLAGSGLGLVLFGTRQTLPDPWELVDLVDAHPLTVIRPPSPLPPDLINPDPLGGPPRGTPRGDPPR